MSTGRAVYIQKFCQGGANLGHGQKRGGGAPGGSLMVSCEVLHSRGGEDDTRGGRMPPLKYGPDWLYDVLLLLLLLPI